MVLTLRWSTKLIVYWLGILDTKNSRKDMVSRHHPTRFAFNVENELKNGETCITCILENREIRERHLKKKRERPHVVTRLMSLWLRFQMALMEKFWLTKFWRQFLIKNEGNFTKLRWNFGAKAFRKSRNCHQGSK